MSTKNIDHLVKILKEKKTVITRAIFWNIPHRTDKQDISLKIGRYKKNQGFEGIETLENSSPKSELTLDDEEFRNLIDFIQENYEPFKTGTKAYIPLDRPLDSDTAQALKNLFNLPGNRGVLNFLLEHSIIPEHLILALHQKQRMDAIATYESMLRGDLTEHPWQKWFEQNPWILGTEFVRILDERAIDIEHISDFLMQAYDGFLDIVEIKRPEGRLKFWAEKVDHGNYVPSPDLTKAITQATRYIYEVEREANSVKFFERVNHVKTIKPRCILIFGRSHDWNQKQAESYRILNSCFHNLSILTYDHVLDRAKRLLSHEDTNDSEEATDVPF